ncbi:MAG TPA: tRNA dihydrouridine(20/20a) synthase DusA [Gammaproteobacteria bacterium]|jgi:tRNA-dihydrouridine synthase A
MSVVRAAPDRRLCVAPMMAHTDRHFRYLLRLLSTRVMLYSEMLTTGALLNGDPSRRLAFDPFEHPVGLQLGGSDPAALARCARIAETAGYDEVNLNIGCPSERVREGRFGACLMAEPALVAECVTAMRETVCIPVTVKSRLGIDGLDGYDDLLRFVETVAAAGCGTFMVHARKAVLGGLSPRQNREVPPLRHEFVHRLKRELPDTEVIVNGGIGSLEEARRQLEHVDGVMIGRAICDNPYLLACADRDIFGEERTSPSRRDVFLRYADYAEARVAEGEALHHVARHVLALFRGEPGARSFRRHLSARDSSAAGSLREALAFV